MRVLSLVVLSTLSITSGAPAAGIPGIAKVELNVEHLGRNLAAPPKVKRLLRQYDFNKLAELKEERGGTGMTQISEKVDDIITKVVGNGDKTDDIATKVDDLLGKAKPTSKLTAAVEKAAMSADDIAKLKQNIDKYPKGLSSGTMDQIRNVEKMRITDLTTYVKVDGKSLRRKIEPFEGIKIAPKDYLGSNHGREGIQRYTKDKKRKLSAAVVSRPQEQGGGDVLLISSSNPTKNDWLLPKGGWDKGENIQHAALREVVEEGGVNAKLLHNLGVLSDDGHLYHIYKMQAKTVYDDWAESARYRLWVSYDDAIKMLKKRPKMIQMVKKAKAVDYRVNRNKQKPADEALEKITLPGINEAV
ncbi:hypothetical protein PHMEG_00030704 [Phytophthora megakarya]|uniref:Nudix hydrolase domain-containing protein n=1 Tax=Phytophthora megakarya TaxID=4795 RepID=A0A225V191_9STRA|nr:hypothetical protein PHMEG_00030704 [Phytophthora megakarya]